MRCVLCRLLPAGETAGLALSCQSPACVAQPRGCGLREGPHSLPPARLQPSSYCWGVPCSGATEGVAGTVVLNGLGTCALSGVLALHQAQRNFSSEQGTAVTGLWAAPAPVQRRELQCPHHGPRELVLEQAGSSLSHSRAQVWKCEGSTWLCLSPEPRGVLG